MRLADDERAAAVQVGAVVLLAFVVVALSLYQAQVVPEQNEQVEVDHNREVQDRLVAVRSAIVTAGTTGGSPSVTLPLGTSYPDRTVFANPPAPTGTVRTVGTTNPAVNVSLTNVAAEGEAGDFWNGSHNVSTGGLVFRPHYNQYRDAPVTVFEHGVVFNLRANGSAALTGQPLVEGDTLTLLTLNGTVGRTGSRALSLDVAPVSVATRTITVSNDDPGPINVTLHTSVSRSTWRRVLEPEFVANGGNVSAPLGYVSNPDGLNRVTISLVPGEYELRLARVAVGSDGGASTGEDAAYLVPVGQRNRTVDGGETVELTVEARDRFNNPVSGETVAFHAGAGTLDRGRVESDGDGRATVTYTAPSAPGTYRVNATVDGGGTAAENVTYRIEVSSGGGGGGGSYTTQWVDPSGQAGVTCSEAPPRGTCTVDAGDTLFAEVPLTMSTRPTADGADVRYAVSNQSVFTLDPDAGVTDSSGQNSTTLSITGTNEGVANAYVDSGASGDVLNVTVANVKDTITGRTIDNGSGYDSGVEFSFRNSLSRDLTLTDVRVEPQNPVIDALSDPSASSSGEFNVEFYVVTGTTTYSYDWGNGRSLPFVFDFSESDNDDLTDVNVVVQPGNNATFTLYEFRDGGTPYNMTGETVNLTLYFADGTTKSVTLQVESGDEGGGGSPPSVDTFAVTDESTCSKVKGNGNCHKNAVTDYAQYSLDWSVSDPDGDLQSVTVYVNNTDTGTTNDEYAGSSGSQSTPQYTGEYGDSFAIKIVAVDDQGNRTCEVYTGTANDSDDETRSAC